MKNLLKINSKAFCKKRMGISREKVRELMRQIDAEESLMTDNSMLLEAFYLQSALYHDTLFKLISNVI